MTRQSGWLWVGGGLLVGLVASSLVGGLAHVLGVLIAGVFTLLKDLIGIAFSLVGALLGSLLGVAFWGGLGYLGYRWWKGRRVPEREVPWRGHE